MNDMWSRGPRVRRWLVVGEILSATFLTAMSATVVTSTGTLPTGIPATACVLGAFLLRRRSVRWSVTLAVLGGALQFIEPRGFIMFVDMLYGPICSALGEHRDARVRRLGLGAAVAAAVLPGALLVPRWLSGYEVSPHLTEMITLCVMFACAAASVSVGGWTWGYLRLQQRLQVEAAIAVRLSDAERTRLEQTAAQSAFREQIAAEMHDVVGHSWAVVAAQADGARYAMRTSPETAERALETIGEVARSSITELREILRQLRYSEGVEGQVGAQQQEALLARMREAGMTIDFVETGEPAASQQIRLTTHRALTEALTNALKHSDLRDPVVVRLDWRDGLTLEARNTVASRSRLPGSGLGLIGMNERVRSLGGDLTTHEHDGTWTLRLHVPAPEPVRAATSGLAGASPDTSSTRSDTDSVPTSDPATDSTTPTDTIEPEETA